MWFNYGNVNGFDFWNNSDAIKPEHRAKMGTIGMGRSFRPRADRIRASLSYERRVDHGQGNDDPRRTRRSCVFASHGEERTIDRITTLKALDRAVFNDDKEGLLGMRVARWLESPNEKGGVFTDAERAHDQGGGRRTGAGATGVYLTSEGKKGDAAWGTRGRWCTLTGTTDGKTVAIAMFDHTGEPGVSDVLACAWVRAVCGEPIGSSYLRSQGRGL